MAKLSCNFGVILSSEIKIIDKNAFPCYSYQKM